jgi:outer membrane protein assembly factor BamB
MRALLKSRVGVTVLACAVAIGFISSGLVQVRHHGPPPPFHATSQALTTYHYDNSRDGVDAADPAFRKLGWAWTTGSSRIDGDVYAEPLVYAGDVYVVTEADELYALSPRTGAVLWQLQVGTPVQATAVRSAPSVGSHCGNVFPLGITGTPVIDPKTGVMYLAAEEQRSGSPTWRGIEHALVAVDLHHRRIEWQRSIDPPGQGDGQHGTYVIPAEQQRSALTLASGRVYVELGGLSGDCGAYHGFVVSLPESGSEPLTSYETPSPHEDALWAPSGAAVSSGGDLYVATGNGAVSDSRFEMDNAVIELSPSLKVLSYYAPADWSIMNRDDLDLGSAGPLLLPGGNLVFEAGKPSFAAPDGKDLTSFGYLLDAHHLGGLGHPLYRGDVCPDAGFVYGGEAATEVDLNGARTLVVFVPCSGGTVALAVHGGKHPSFERIWVVSGGSPNGPPIVAGGLVWAISTGADYSGAAGGYLYGISEATGKVRVIERLDDPVDHFVTPAAGDGQLFIGLAGGIEEFRP